MKQDDGGLTMVGWKGIGVSECVDRFKDGKTRICRATEFLMDPYLCWDRDEEMDTFPERK